mmetsp:Transcript_43684/g.79712  ORF Transcript_43684/g.79712 Transcript_43684/m.79712 type:complete len:387 (-) Transcript_43684:56-1216(-)
MTAQRGVTSEAAARSFNRKLAMWSARTSSDRVSTDASETALGWGRVQAKSDRRAASASVCSSSTTLTDALTPRQPRVCARYCTPASMRERAAQLQDRASTASRPLVRQGSSAVKAPIEDPACSSSSCATTPEEKTAPEKVAAAPEIRRAQPANIWPRTTVPPWSSAVVSKFLPTNGHRSSQANSHNLSSEDLEVWKAFEESAKALERERDSLEKLCRELEKGGTPAQGQQGGTPLQTPTAKGKAQRTFKRVTGKGQPSDPSSARCLHMSLLRALKQTDVKPGRPATPAARCVALRRTRENMQHWASHKDDALSERPRVEAQCDDGPPGNWFAEHAAGNDEYVALAGLVWQLIGGDGGIGTSSIEVPGGSRRLTSTTELGMLARGGC